MATDLFTTAIIRSTARSFSVADLIRTAEMLKQEAQADLVEVLYATWVQHNQDNPLLYAVLFNHSVVLSDGGKLEAARACLEKALKLNPEFIPAHINLGRLYERLGNVAPALVQWSVALARMAPVNGASVGYKTTALNQSGRALEAANQDEAAEEMLRQSLELDSHQSEVIQHVVALRQRQCKWPTVLPSERVSARAQVEGMSPLSMAAHTDDPIMQLAAACKYNRDDVGTPKEAHVEWPAAIPGSGRLRIGYLSSDLREHAVGFLMTEVLGLHDREAVEVFAYYCGPEAKDKLHAHFRETADHFKDITSLGDEAAARQMVEDGIQILVDLNGYTREARLKVVARRPAPVIVNWLGFPGTMASPYHHYIIADDWIIPPSHEGYFSEKVLRLPCYQPSSRKREVAAATPSRRDVGLPAEGMVYCCFNGAHKINRFTFNRWLMIIARVPGSVLWLLGGSEAANRRLQDYAAERGVAKERIVFGDKLPNPAHLARYALADLFLDTTPYGAHTTASDALWMGLPVLTFSGRSFASRVCGSLVRAAGTPEMACSTAEELVERAVELGSEPGKLATVRDKLRAQRDTCVLFDMPRLVRRLEDLFRQMWHEHQSGQLPQPDLANLEVYLEVGSEVDYDDVEVQTIADYEGWWRARLARRHHLRPIPHDRRLVQPSEQFRPGECSRHPYPADHGNP